MKALTLTQPWATLVAIGAKRIETRSWRTDYRGPLAIHAAKGFPPQARRLAFEEPFYSVLHGAGLIDIAIPGVLGVERLPRGTVVALAQLVDVLPTESVRDRIEAQELAYGDYSDHRFAWVLEEIDELVMPVPARGYLGLWDCGSLPRTGAMAASTVSPAFARSADG